MSNQTNPLVLYNGPEQPPDGAKLWRSEIPFVELDELNESLLNWVKSEFSLESRIEWKDELEMMKWGKNAKKAGQPNFDGYDDETRSESLRECLYELGDPSDYLCIENGLGDLIWEKLGSVIKDDDGNDYLDWRHRFETENHPWDFHFGWEDEKPTPTVGDKSEMLWIYLACAFVGEDFI